MENGDIAVVLLDDEATVKTFYKENGMFRLQPENQAMKPIYTKDVYILGKVVANFRYYKLKDMSNQILCSTGTMVGRANGYDYRVIIENKDLPGADGFELMMLKAWYDKLPDGGVLFGKSGDIYADDSL